MIDEAGLPATGGVEVVPPAGAVEIVEELAHEDVAHRHPENRLLIVLDVDGTVLLEDESLSPGIVEAVAEAQRAGHEIMLATGRSWEATVGVMRVLDIAPEYAVCSNGAVVMRRDDMDPTHYERFHTETFDASEVLELLRGHLPDARFLVELPDGRRLYTDYLDDWNLHLAARVEFDELAHQPVSRVVVVAPERSEYDFLDLVGRIGLNQVSYAVGWTAWLDIAPQGVDKGSALELVREWLGIDPARVLVMGDGRNDLGMFAWARRHGGRAIAMAQGPREVHDAADEVTLTVEEGGVAAVLRALDRERGA
ncbi:HAD hydrolase family protein [Microbacterium sp. X-17]|uniref:HAD family hydrolase n=1 Tax=Microbacterium sp. X-17 TaxID=3144404 RepID=UPI0031F4EBB0